jgi:4,5-DOPA dioxygenase extradiol
LTENRDVSRLPTIFISHGSPMHALDRGAAGNSWSRLGRELPKPRAIVIASAHWETSQPALSGALSPGTVHDFSGFPDELYRLRYPAAGAPELAERARNLLEAASIPASVDPRRGLDHGAWSPLLHMYPEADVPVVELSVQPGRSPRQHIEVGRALSALADEGILVIGSGHMTHNLREFFSGNGGSPAYVEQFRAWVRERLEKHELDALADYRTRAPGAQRAHPSEEHFLPLFVALGAAGDYSGAERVLDLVDGPLAMDAYVFR